MMQVHTTVNRLMAEHEAAIKHAYPLRDVLGAGPNVSHGKPWYAKVDADGVLTGLGLLLLAVLLVGCTECFDSPEHKAAVYIREHHCTRTHYDPTISSWDYHKGEPGKMVSGGYSMWKCPTVSIVVLDDEEQP